MGLTGFTELINRLRALTLILLPVEVDPKTINEPIGRVITPKVVSAYRNAAGDFVEAVSESFWTPVHISNILNF